MTTYKTTSGLVKASGPLWLVGVAMAVNLAITAWFVYLLYRVAVTVNAWPF